MHDLDRLDPSSGQSLLKPDSLVRPEGEGERARCGDEDVEDEAERDVVEIFDELGFVVREVGTGGVDERLLQIARAGGMRARMHVDEADLYHRKGQIVTSAEEYTDKI
jgi:hypothetical protein